MKKSNQPSNKAFKKELRKAFRETCLKRDKYKCRMCQFQSSPEKANEELDVHHIIDRHEIANDGYTPLNGISICHRCHIKAEQFHETGVAYLGYSRKDLFKVIDSSAEKAIAESERLNGN